MSTITAPRSTSTASTRREGSPDALTADEEGVLWSVVATGSIDTMGLASARRGDR
jgi:hypothetical protein